ncbi:MAG: cytochrome b/b6 domain-containing protein, partial [Rhodospirillaceae bacterium]|nr:cytochrome b/b6 domain-containing protein [Rhodospirillaceae bacterium]
SLIMLHVYFGVRPEKLFYLRSMVFGWITREELEKNHDPEQWSEAGDRQS